MVDSIETPQGDHVDAAAATTAIAAAASARRMVMGAPFVVRPSRR